MAKYYVYKVAKGSKESKTDITRALVYVIDPMAFALTQFNPMTMEFSGVVVEAETLEDATKIYNRPGPDDKVFWTDEPTPTKTRRDMFEKEPIGTLKDVIQDTERAINQLAINKLHLAINSSLDLLNKQISEMAFRMRQQTDSHQDVTAEQLYARLKERSIETLQRTARYDRPGDDV